MIKNCKIICVVEGCSTTGLLYNDKFHKVKKRWLPRIGRMDLDTLSETEIYTQRYRICNNHFTEQAYTSSLKTGLASEAEPELSLPHPPDPNSNSTLNVMNMPANPPDEGGECNNSTVTNINIDAPKIADSPAAAKGDDVPIMSVATVYSGSEDEAAMQDDENTEDSNDLENMSLEERLAKNSTSCAAVDPLLLEEGPEQSNNKQQSLYVYQEINTEIPSHMRVGTCDSRLAENFQTSQELSEILKKKDKLIRTLEKCIIEKSILIQKLTVENLELKKQINK